MDVLLTDGTERSALAAARSLIGAGWEVGVAAGGGRRLSLAGVSRGVRRLRLETDPLADPPGYAAEVGQLAARHGVRVVLPVTDASVEAILAGREHLPRTAALPFPDLATYRKAADKGAILEYARDAGLAVPDTVVLADPAAELPDAEFFPAVLKPHRSVLGGRHFGVQFVSTVQQCRAALRTLAGGAFPVLLQRRVRGSGEGLFVLRWNGRVVAEFAHRRLREKPPEGGVSVYRESIALDADLAAAGRRLLEALDWQGVAMIECKRDASSGQPVLMEINGRLWGSLQLAIDAGVDFPRLLVSCALGEERGVPAITHYRVGVRSRWFWGDVDNLYLQLRNGGGAAGKLAALRDFVRVGFRRTREEIWRWRDPAPFLLESLQQLGLAR
jgi:predicted ATP-grasp superfamily ATP-dependent carboligase